MKEQNDQAKRLATTRRGFLKGMGAFVAALAVGAKVGPAASEAAPVAMEPLSPALAEPDRVLFGYPVYSFTYLSCRPYWQRGKWLGGRYARRS